MVSTNDEINFEEISFNPFRASTLLENMNESDFDFLNENQQQQINTTIPDKIVWQKPKFIKIHKNKTFQASTYPLPPPP